MHSYWFMLAPLICKFQKWHLIKIDLQRHSLKLEKQNQMSMYFHLQKRKTNEKFSVSCLGANILINANAKMPKVLSYTAS